MRIVFCGSGQFAVPSLRAVIQSGHQVSLVVTQPPRPSGRGVLVHQTPVAQAALEAGLNLGEMKNINAPESVEAIRQAVPDAIVVVDFGQMVRAAVRQTAPLGAFNLHGSLLPELRGAAPVNWAIIRGYQKTGVTTFSLVDKMDAGAMYLQDEKPITPRTTAQELRHELADVGACLVVRTLSLLASGSAQGIIQDESRATLAPRLTKADGWIDWTQPAGAVRNRIHGTWPWPGGHALLQRTNGEVMPVIIARADVFDGQCEEPGLLDGQLRVSTGSGKISIVEVLPAGKKLMEWKAFVNGYRPQPGEKFVAPPDESKQ